MTNTLERPDTDLVRWTAVVYYRADAGIVDVTHDMSELYELQDIVERGPHWDCIDRIEIRRAGDVLDVTVETAALL